MSINRNCIVIAEKTILSTNIDEDLGLMNIDKGYYYTLNDIGKSIWNLLTEEKKIEEIINLLMKDYNVPYEVCSKDVFELIEVLEANGLVKVVN